MGRQIEIESDRLTKWHCFVVSCTSHELAINNRKMITQSTIEPNLSRREMVDFEDISVGKKPITA